MYLSPVFFLINDLSKEFLVLVVSSAVYQVWMSQSFPGHFFYSWPSKMNSIWFSQGLFSRLCMLAIR